MYLSDSALYLLSLYRPIPRLLPYLCYAVWYLLLSPLCVGLLYYYTDLFRAAHGEGSAHVPPAVVFTPYAKAASLIRAWAQVTATVFLLLPIALSFLPTVAALRLLLSGERVTFGCALLLFGITAFLSALYFNARLTPVLFLSANRPELSLGDAVCRTWHLTADVALTAVLLQLGLIVAAVLSLILTAGIAFFLYVLPISVLTYVGCCHEIARRCDLL